VDIQDETFDFFPLWSSGRTRYNNIVNLRGVLLQLSLVLDSFLIIFEGEPIVSDGGYCPEP
jgi:hypothetical protein